MKHQKEALRILTELAELQDREWPRTVRGLAHDASIVVRAQNAGKAGAERKSGRKEK